MQNTEFWGEVQGFTNEAKMFKGNARGAVKIKFAHFNDLRAFVRGHGAVIKDKKWVNYKKRDGRFSFNIEKGNALLMIKIRGEK